MTTYSNLMADATVFVVGLMVSVVVCLVIAVVYPHVHAAWMATLMSWKEWRR